MSDINRIDTTAYVTVQGQYAVVNEGSSYGIINIHTKQVIARNILSFLDCVKTLEYIVGKTEVQNSEPIQTSAFIDESDISNISNQGEINFENKKLDELDLALVRSIASYFEEMTGKIRRYHQDHNASKEEADVIANYYLKIAAVIKNIQTQQDVKKLITSIETLKEKVSRYEHESYKYRWSTGLEKEVLVKLRKMK
jgi:transcriptional regulator of heat shock response